MSDSHSFRLSVTQSHITSKEYRVVLRVSGFQLCNSLRRRASARNVSFRISLRWPIYIVSPVDKAKLFCTLYLETFATSEEKDDCDEDCTQPCEHTEFEMSLSYAGLLRNVFIHKLNSSANVAKDFPFYDGFLKMSGPEKMEYIE